MPADREKVKEFTVRIPNELWEKIEKLFEKRFQEDLSKNRKVVTLIKEAMAKYDLSENKESREKAE